MKRSTFLAFIAAIASSAAFAYPAGTVGGGIGLGYGLMSHGFEQAGSRARLDFAAPGGVADLEASFRALHMGISLGLLAFPSSASLGGNAVDLEGYSKKSAGDITAIYFGYILPLPGKLSLIADVGWHFSTIDLEPSSYDPTKLSLGSDYTLAGISVTPRLRCSLGGPLYATLSIPVGLDFGNGNLQYDSLGNPTGVAAPRIFPADLSPDYRGLSVGAYIEIGYLFALTQ